MFRKNATASTYIYDQNTKAKFGIGKYTQAPVFQTGKWHHINLQVTLNTKNQATGEVKLFIDGKAVVTISNITLRAIDSEATMIQTFMFSTFHGGQDPTWAPQDKHGKPATVHALFDNIIITEGLTPPTTP